jgi:acyl carrier protein phosphodiesterase
MFLAGDDPELLVGSFMGDFVKGELGERFPKRIRQGIMLHRKTDSFARDEQHYQRSRRRIDPHYGLYRGILVDLFYDHLLVRGWGDWSAEPLEIYLQRARRVIDAHQEVMPSELQRLVPIVFEELLPSYGEVSGIGAALCRMSRRIRRNNPLAGGERELTRLYQLFQEDFIGFNREAIAFASAFIARTAE